MAGLEGKAAIPDVIRGLLAEDVAQLAVAQDLDYGTLVELVDSVRQIADSYLAERTLE